MTKPYTDITTDQHHQKEVAPDVSPAVVIAELKGELRVAYNTINAHKEQICRLQQLMEEHKAREKEMWGVVHTITKMKS